MYLKRRGFIKNGSLAAAGTLLIPKFLQALHMQDYPLQAAGDKILVVIQLSGGNDGLNTVIPISNDIYFKSRPGIAIGAQKANKLVEGVALHPSLKSFSEWYNNGELLILNDVGYPNPDRSHFRSMDIWHSASAADVYLNTGWLGRYLDARCNGCAQPTQVLEIDDILSFALKGENHKGLAFQDPARLFSTSNSPAFKQFLQQHHQGEEPVVDYLYKTLGDTIQSADTIFKASKQHISQVPYPDSGLGKSLKTIGALIGSNIDTSVYYASLGSFDTHVNQAQQQGRLLTELNDALSAFVKDLKQKNRFKDVVVVTFSEFGRRVAQNASGGTDHGTANNMFVISGGLKKQGLFNPISNLDNLDNGDLKYRIDFREVYKTLLQNWLKTPNNSILPGKFNTLQFV